MRAEKTGSCEEEDDRVLTEEEVAKICQWQSNQYMKCGELVYRVSFSWLVSGKIGNVMISPGIRKPRERYLCVGFAFRVNDGTVSNINFGTMNDIRDFLSGCELMDNEKGARGFCRSE